jgi:hypothetical protein
MGLAAALVVPLNAFADTTSIGVTSATLVAKGVEVDVGVAFTCPADEVVPNSAFLTGLTASVQEAVSKTQQAYGLGAYPSDIPCTGSEQTAIVQVIANASGPPFRVGPAVVNASVTSCTPDFFTCSGASSGFTTIRLTK